MSDSSFPSGPWTGFYNYGPGDRHRMELQLQFSSGVLVGEGADDIGPFLLQGRYDEVARECHWTKRYLGAHEVFYRGFREGKGIWGTWEISLLAHGGFHIWPREAAEDRSEAQVEERLEPTTAFGPELRAGRPTHTGRRVDNSPAQNYS